jgi:hypothetical protein
MLLKAARGVNAAVNRSFYFFFQKEALSLLFSRAAAWSAAPAGLF